MVTFRKRQAHGGSPNFTARCIESEFAGTGGIGDETQSYPHFFPVDTGTVASPNNEHFAAEGTVIAIQKAKRMIDPQSTVGGILYPGVCPFFLTAQSNSSSFVPLKQSLSNYSKVRMRRIP
jgi:hypothetical protein